MRNASLDGPPPARIRASVALEARSVAIATSTCRQAILTERSSTATTSASFVKCTSASDLCLPMPLEAFSRSRAAASSTGTGDAGGYVRAQPMVACSSQVRCTCDPNRSARAGSSDTMTTERNCSGSSRNAAEVLTSKAAMCALQASRRDPSRNGNGAESASPHHPAISAACIERAPAVRWLSRAAKFRSTNTTRPSPAPGSASVTAQPAGEYVSTRPWRTRLRTASGLLRASRTR